MTWGTGKLPPRRPWSRVRAELAELWHPGDHISIIAPTGYGKSYLGLRGLIPMRRHVIVLDPKGGDDTLDRYGGRRITRAPTRFDLWRYGDERGGWKLRVNPDLRSARAVFDQTMRIGWRDSRRLRKDTGEGITYYVDETRILADKLKMRDHLETLWIGGRSRGVSMVGATQAPRYVPSEFYDQPTFVAIGNVRDRVAVRRLAEIGGDTDLIQHVVPRLSWHEFLIVGPRYAVRTTMPAPRKRKR